MIAEGFFFFASNQRPDQSRQESKTKGAAAVFVCTACAEGVSCLDTAASGPGFSFGRSLSRRPCSVRTCVRVDSGTLPVFKAHHRAGWCPFPEKGEVVAHVLRTCEGGSVQRPPCGLTHPNRAALQPTSAAACKVLQRAQMFTCVFFSCMDM